MPANATTPENSPVLEPVNNDAGPMSILHATDLLPDGGIAFEHAVAVARALSARLTSIHAKGTWDRTSRDAPHAGDLLTRWKDDPSAVPFEWVEHQCCDDPVDTLLDAIHALGGDLLVVGMREAKGLKAWFKGSVSLAVAANVRMPTLFVKVGREGFVNGRTGKLSLERVLLPVGDVESAQAEIDELVQVVTRLGHGPLKVYLLHTDDRGLPNVALPEHERITWIDNPEQGPLDDAVQRCTVEMGIDLVVMATRGTNSVGDFLVGTHTEHVVKASPVPVLSIPLETGETSKIRVRWA